MSITTNGTTLENVYYNGTELDKVYMNGTLVFGEEPTSFKGLCFTANTAGSTITLTKVGSPAWSGSYSTNGSNWVTYTPELWAEGGTYTNTITLNNVGDKVYFKGTFTGDNSTSNFFKFVMSGSIAASGNMMSFCSGDNFESVTTIPYKYMFRCLFIDCNITTAPELPATTLTERCYDSMFARCLLLTTAPTLPAMNLADGCYRAMFSHCPIITPPSLSAMALYPSCYASMFENCTSLTIPPELPAISLAQYCYSQMFLDCTSLAINTSGTYEWRIPTTGTGTQGTSSLDGMLLNTAGNVTGTPSINTTYYCETKPVEADTPLCFTANTAGSTIKLYNGSSSSGTIPWSGYYSTDGVTWNTYSLNTVLTLTNVGDSVYFKGTLTGAQQWLGPHLQYVMTGSINGSGNIMSLCSGDNYLSATTLPYNYTFVCLFENCWSLKTPPKLPATTVTTFSYAYMFNYTGITVPPELPATTLALNCYSSMFMNCSALTTTPELPATTMANSCYGAMFFGCSNITTAPDLPATTLKPNCYSGMFRYCSNLISAPIISATTLAKECCTNMFDGCTTLVTPPELPATTLAESCYKEMFSGCYLLTSTPTLPATTLATSCYYGMFQNCTRLTTISKLPATTLSPSCYTGMFNGCTRLVTPPALPGVNLAASCYYNMFYGCTSLTTPPELPATTLADYCYRYMFSGCTSLAINTSGTYEWRIPTTGTGTTASSALDYMLQSTGGEVVDTPSINTTYYCENEPIGYDKYTPLCFTANTAGSTITLTKSGEPSWTGSYSADGATWYSYTPEAWNSSQTYTNTITLVNAGDRVYFKGVYSADNDTDKNLRFVMTGSIAADGNIMSMCSGDNFIEATTIPYNHCFIRLFYDCEVMTSAPLLPATTLKPYCYSYLFGQCYALTTPPELPAKIMTEGCYGSMFLNCTALTIAPELPAESLAASCYSDMFHSCTSITTPPLLPHTELMPYCYSCMFSGCTSLTTAPELPATTLTTGCYSDMFRYCTSLTTPPELPATTLADYCYYYMFYKCTALTTAPELPATNLTQYCYCCMFGSCTNLINPPIMAATTLAKYCCSSMFSGCSSLVSAPSLLATSFAKNCYLYMFQYCTSLTTVPKLFPRNGDYGQCIQYMFSGCTSLYVSDTPVSGVAEKAWVIPNDGVTTYAYNGAYAFTRCLGTRTSDALNISAGEQKTYYTQNEPV